MTEETIGMPPATRMLHETLLRALKMAVSAYETWLKTIPVSSSDARPSRELQKATALSH